MTEESVLDLPKKNGFKPRRAPAPVPAVINLNKGMLEHLGAILGQTDAAKVLLAGFLQGAGAEGTYGVEITGARLVPQEPQR